MKKNGSKKRLTVNIENVYENDYKLMKIISRTKEMRNNNHSLTERKNNLKNLMQKIYDDENNESGKGLHENNQNFHNEYNLFNKRKSKKETKIIFKDLVKLYKSRGYRIPNFSINEHNLFKINPLLEGNTTTISNGLMVNQLLKKNDESEKVISYLRKLGGLLSEKLSNDDFDKNFKKFKIVKPKYLNEEDSVENLKKQIEILINLINTNALDKLDEPKKVNFNSYSRQSSLKSIKYKSNKKLLYLNNQRYSTSRRNTKISNKNLNNILTDRRVSTESSVTNESVLSKLKKMKSGYEKSSDNVYKVLNFNNNIQVKNPSKTPKDLKIPTLNLQVINQKREENSKNNFNNRITPKKPKFASEKLNNIFINDLKTPKNNKLNWNRNSIMNIKKNLMSPLVEVNLRHLSTVKNYSNNISSMSDEPYDSNNQTTKKKNMSCYPYSNRNEFINFAYYKFSKKGVNNCENYIKNYLNKVQGYNDDEVDHFFKTIYDKNMKVNLKELENQVTENNIYSKTERLYLSNHLIKRIRPTLKNMNEKDKIILKLEKIFTRAIISK